MGYSTDFKNIGRGFVLDRPMSSEHAGYLRKFNGTRHMRRHSSMLAGCPDPAREAAGLPVGKEGEYYTGDGTRPGTLFPPEDQDESIVNHNEPPSSQPGLWCQWTISDDGSTIIWDGGEKFYYYVEWLKYLVDRFIRPWGYTLDGEVRWQGEDEGDRGTITVDGNKITTRRY